LSQHCLSQPSKGKNTNQRVFELKESLFIEQNA